MTIRARIMFLQLMMVAFILLLSLSFFRITGELGDNLNALEQRTFPVLLELEKLNFLTEQLVSSTYRIRFLRFSSGGGPDATTPPAAAAASAAMDRRHDLAHELAEYDEVGAAIEQHKAHYHRLVTQFFPAEAVYLDGIIQTLGEITAAADILITLPRAKAETIRIEADLEGFRHEMEAWVDQARAQEMIEIHNNSGLLQRRIQRLQNQSIAFAIVFALLGYLFSLFLSRSLIRPIEQLIDATGRMGQGEFEMPAAPGHRDEIQRLFESFQEMAASRRAFEADRERELRFQQILLETIPSPVFYKDAAGAYIGCNQAFVDFLGLPRERIIGATVFDIAPGELAQTYHQADVDLIRSGEGQVYETQVRHADGTTHDVVFYKAVFSAVDGQVDGLIGIMLDISDRARLEKELRLTKESAERANQAKSLFLAHMSHEIRTPLNAILGYAEVLGEADLAPEAVRQLNIIATAGRHLLNVVNDILDLSRVEAGRLSLESIDFSLPALIDEIRGIFQEKSVQQGVALVFDLAPGVPERLHGDLIRIQQVLINLIGNGLKFTQKGEVRLTIGLSARSRHANLLQFAVSDTGPGIPPEKRESIFQPFVQADGSITRHYGGSGLGLTISARLIEMMGGDLWVDSEVGRGSTFSFVLPLTEAAGPETEPVKGAEASPFPAAARRFASGGRHAPRLLLVEDSEDNRLLIKTFLKGTGYHIEEAVNGREGVERYQEADGAFDLILMDVQMPVMDGYEATRAIRRLEEIQNRNQTPILALTAHAFQEDFDKSHAAGCDEHLIKPIQKRRLLETLAYYLGPHEA